MFCSAQSKIGQKQGFSKCDLEKLNKWYGCTSKLTNDRSCSMGGPNPEQPSTVEPQTVVPQTQEPPVTNLQCVDTNPFQCGIMKQSCYVYPGYYLLECKKTCDNCDGEIEN